MWIMTTSSSKGPTGKLLGPWAEAHGQKKEPRDHEIVLFSE